MNPSLVVKRSLEVTPGCSVNAELARAYFKDHSMNLLLFAKRYVELAPEPLGRVLCRVPFSWRLGPAYGRHQRNLAWVATASPAEIRNYVLSRVRRLVEYAQDTNQFYRHFYARHRFSPNSLRTYADLQRIPIVTKADFKAFDLSARSTPHFGCLRVNTGGTSGEPLVFYLNRTAFAKEWAHMHHIWASLGYRQTDVKLTFRGKNLGERPLQYNAPHNEYVVNAYVDPSHTAEAIDRVMARRAIRFIHGYPSTIYEFVRYCSMYSPDVVSRLSRMLKGVLLGSEFPAPIYRNTIAEKLHVPTLSWYGHSEMAVLAYETKPYVYEPLHSYGYCEAVKTAGGEYRLVGTSYDNTASPFIRYDTGDTIHPVNGSDLLEGFQIASGRVGDMILDVNGNSISLTALIFGRHHRLFDYATFLQVKQPRMGEATIVVTLPRGVQISADLVERDFDGQDVAIRFRFELVAEPIRTRSGKTPLLLPMTTYFADGDECGVAA